MSFDFNELQIVLANWPNQQICERPVNELYGRIAQILTASLKCKKMQQCCDLLPLMRQVMQRHRTELNCDESIVQLCVPLGYGWPDPETWKKFGFYYEKYGETQFKVSSVRWKPDWLNCPDGMDILADTYSDEDCRTNLSVPIDPCVKDSTGFAAYSSEGQRESIRGAFFTPEGSTLVVNLPTGSGKSLVGYMPSLLGGVEGNLTLFIVPTIALAIEQAEKMKAIYQKTGSAHSNTPLAWHSGVPAEDKKIIKTNIKNGSQPIIFTSPESVCGSLRWSLYEAARRKFLTYVVIDEAHLVSQWGIEFRPDFQAVSGIWRGLHRECGGVLKTLLMTATLTEETLETLQVLFSIKDKPFQVVSHVFLRPEPRYWHHKSDGYNDKKAKVLEIVRVGSRPMILYVTEPKEAKEWLDILKSEGYSRVASFHGKTSTPKRMNIIKEWSDNKLDIIVATSAFGVGMDKGDVRTILHATMPENLDRYYQEVGRGGRDNKASLAMLIYTQKDLDKARGMAFPKVVTDELGMYRWQAMVHKQQPLGNDGLFKLDLATVPPYLRGQGDYNRAWNMRTLLLMVRAGAVQLEAEAPPLSSEKDNEMTDEEVTKYFNHVVLRYCKGNHCVEEFWNTEVASARDSSIAASQRNFDLLRQILEGNREVGSALAELYSINNRCILVPPSCGGCPECRVNGRVNIPFRTMPVFPLHVVSEITNKEWGELFPMVPTHPVVITYSRDEGDVFRKELPQLIVALARVFGAREVVGTSFEMIIKDKAFSQIYKNIPGRFLITRTLDEDTQNAYESPLARISMLLPWDTDPIPDRLFMLNKKFHLIFAPDDVRDAHHPHRRYCDVASNILPVNQLRSRLNNVDP